MSLLMESIHLDRIGGQHFAKMLKMKNYPTAYFLACFDLKDVCARMCNAAYIIFIMWNSISGLDTCYHFRLNISCGVAVTVRCHQNNIR